MTEALVEKTCAPCRGGIPPLTRAEAEELLPQAPEWRSWIKRTGSKRPFVSGTSGRRSHSFKRLASLRRRKVTIPTLASAGATGLCRCAPRRSRVSTTTISSWRQRSIGLHQWQTKLLELTLVRKHPAVVAN